MFKHGMTGKTYYSVREKINYYSGILKGKTPSTPELKEKAKKRLPELQRINEQSYNEPKIIVTDDKKFGNGISKPRLCVAVKEDDKKRVLVAPIMKNNSNYIILDNDIERQISKTSDGKNKWIDRNDIYEGKYIIPHAELTARDKAKIKRLYK
ncbi:MAG: hypothetical protein K2J16_03855 [Clostridia bacterium]|nr:hypothetical protein [Clostridia bacterium]